MFKLYKSNIFLIVTCLILFLAVFFVSAENTRRELSASYRAGKAMIDAGNYQDGIDCLKRLGDYQDSLQYIEGAKNRIRYDQAVSQFYAGQYEEARTIFEYLVDVKIANMGDQEKSPEEYINEISGLIESQNKKRQDYNDAIEYFETGDYQSAYSLLKDLKGYSEESNLLMEKCAEMIKRLSLSKTISAGVRFSAGVTEDKQVEFAGNDPGYKEILDTWNNIVSVSAKGYFVIGLKEDGSVVTTGRIGDYRIDTSDWRNIIQVASGELYVVGLKSDGTLTAQGHNGDRQIDIDEWNNIVSVAAGPRHTVGLDKEGHIYITGYGSKGQLRDISNHSDKWVDIVSISAGGRKYSYTAALKKDGTVVVAYPNSQHRFYVDDWTDIVAIAAGDSHIVGLKSNGRVIFSSIDIKESKEIEGWENIAAVDAGFGLTLGLTETGKVKAIGNERQGQKNVDNWNKISRIEEWDFTIEEDN